MYDTELLTPVHVIKANYCTWHHVRALYAAVHTWNVPSNHGGFPVLIMFSQGNSGKMLYTNVVYVLRYAQYYRCSSCACINAFLLYEYMVLLKTTMAF